MNQSTSVRPNNDRHLGTSTLHTSMCCRVDVVRRCIAMPLGYSSRLNTRSLAIAEDPHYIVFLYPFLSRKAIPRAVIVRHARSYAKNQVNRGVDANVQFALSVGDVTLNAVCMLCAHPLASTELKYRTSKRQFISNNYPTKDKYFLYTMYVCPELSS